MPERRAAGPAAAAEPAWSVYLLRCADGTLYTGIATDVARRLDEHASGKRGAKYLRGRGPLQLEQSLVVGDRGTATRLEHRIKRLPKSDKEALAGSPAMLRRLVADCQ